MSEEISIAELRGQIEAIRSTQLALLLALATQQDLDLPGVARAARSFAAKSDAQGETLAALNAELAVLDALAALPKR